MKHKRNNPTCDPWESQGNEKKCNFCSIAFSINISIRKENIISDEHKTKKPFKMILHVELVTSLSKLEGQSKMEHSFLKFDRDVISSIGLTTQLRVLVTHPIGKIISNGFFVLCSSEIIFSFLIIKSKLKALKIEDAFFDPLGYPKGRTLDYFFYASYIRHNFHYKLIPISMNYLKYF